MVYSIVCLSIVPRETTPTTSLHHLPPHIQWARPSPPPTIKQMQFKRNAQQCRPEPHPAHHTTFTDTSEREKKICRGTVKQNDCPSGRAAFQTGGGVQERGYGMLFRRAGIIRTRIMVFFAGGLCNGENSQERPGYRREFRRSVPGQATVQYLPAWKVRRLFSVYSGWLYYWFLHGDWCTHVSIVHIVHIIV